MTIPPRGALERGAVSLGAPEDTDLWLVASRTWCLRMPVELPIRYTHCYLLVGSQGEVLVVDPGWDVPDGIDRIDSTLREIGSSVSRIVGIVATHAHRDHVGLAHELAGLAGCWVGMHHAELEDHVGAETVEAWRARESVWMNALGVPPDERPDALIPLEGVESILTHTRADRPLAGGEEIAFGDRVLAVLHTPGHSIGSLCLVDSVHHLVFTGDTLLPHITPNIGWAPHGAPDPLGAYLESLSTLSRYDDWTALPGHEWPFTGLNSRAAYLRTHHAERDEEILAAIDQEDSVWSLARRLSWSRGWDALNGFQRRIAAAETAAHLRRLVLNGRLRQDAARYAAIVASP